MLEKIVFFVENVSEISESSDPNFCNITIDAFSDGPNHHNLIISEDTLKKSADSIYEVPIVFKYDPWKDDLMGHEPDEVPCGFISKIDNPIQFVKLPDNRTMLRVLGKIWKRYSGKLIDVLKRDGGKKAVSVEMEVLDFDEIKAEIKAFAMRAVTIIGSDPAIPDAGLTVLSFEKDKEHYYQKFESKYKVDFSKENAFMEDDKYRNEGRALYGKMLGESNEKSLISSAYLSFEEGYGDSPSTKLKYPIGRWRGNTLCLSKSGLQFASSKLQSLGITSGSAIDKLKEYYSILGLSTESFSTEIEKEENELKDEKVMMEDEKKEEVEMAVEEEKKEEIKEEPKEEEKMAVEEDKKEEEKEEDFGCGKEEYEKKISEFSTKIEAYEKELEGLRKFKSDREEQDKLFALEQLFSEVKESLSKDKLEEFRTRSEELKFSDVPAFSNEVKAATFDVVKKVSSEDTIKRMATTVPVQEKKKNPFW